MQLGLVGLGKMGSNMRARLRARGHDVVGYDPRPEVTDVASLADLASALGPGDLVIDGGNSRYTDDRGHADRLAASGIGFLDCGVSGGIWGREEGYELAGISAALFARFTSRQADSPAMKAVSALRNQFGGHAVQRAGQSGT